MKQSIMTMGIILILVGCIGCIDDAPRNPDGFAEGETKEFDIRISDAGARHKLSLVGNITRAGDYYDIFHTHVIDGPGVYSVDPYDHERVASANITVLHRSMIHNAR